MSKYVIKNCPAYCEPYCFSHEENYDYTLMCKLRSNCPLKKIVEECNNAKMRANDYARNPYSGGVYDEANRILDFLDIEECE